MSTKLSTVFLAGAGGVALGYGGYYASQVKEISKYEKDFKDIQSLVTKEKTSYSSATKQIEEQEAKIKELAKKDEDQRKVLKEAEGKVEAARKQLAAAETDYKKKQEDAKKVAQEVQTAASRLANLKAEGARAKEAVTLGEKSLVLARQKFTDSQKLLNPLNHPKVKSMLGK